MANSFVDFFSPRYGAFSFLYASTSDPCNMENFVQALGTCQTNLASTGNKTKTGCMAATLSARIIDITASLAMAVLLLIPFLWGVVICYRKREQAWRSMLLAIILGILLSVPLVPPRDASKMRAFAVTQPLMITVAAVGLVDMAQFFSQRKKLRFILKVKSKDSTGPELSSAHGLVIFSLILSLFVLLSPLSAKWLAHDPQVVQAACPAPLEARSFRINPGSALELVQENAVSFTWSGLRAPMQRYSSNLESFCVLSDAEEAAIEDLLQLHSGQVLIKPVFLGGENDAQLAVLSKDEVPLQAGYISVCGEIRDGIFYSQDASQ